MLEDLIAAALNDARAKADAAAGDGDAEDDQRPAAAAGVQAALLSAFRSQIAACIGSRVKLTLCAR